ncbi:acyltransferase [Burkholderiales bacterium]|nr:acyltransferase [Burkholderiales bacterium]
MKYRKEIDGLRALAVLPVILFHAGFTTFSGGFVGVDIFFVISGYLITTIIVDEMDKDSFSLLNFYERRARRILPALFFVMLCTLPFAWFSMFPQDLKSFSQSLVAVPLFASNVHFWLTSGYFDTASELKPLLHTWSLAVEEQYYVLFPLFLMLAWELGKKWIISLLIIVAIVSVSAAQYGSTNHPSFSFYVLPTRAFEILIGALISLYINHKQSIISVSQSVSQSGWFSSYSIRNICV